MSSKTLEGKRSDVINVDPDSVYILGLDEPFADVGPEDPLYDPRVRRKFDESDEGTIGTVIEHGILEPCGITTRKHPKTGDQVPVVVFGRNRTRWAREANKRLADAGSPDRVTLPVMAAMTARTGWDQNGIEAAKIIENEHRNDDDGIILAEKVALFVKRRGGDVAARKEASKAFRRSIPSIESLLRLHGASDALKKAVVQKKVGLTNAYELSKLDVEKQPEALEKLIASGGATVEAVKETVRAERNKAKGKDDSEKARAFSKHLVRRALQTAKGDTPEAKAARKLLEKHTAYDAFRLFAGEVGMKVIPGLTKIIQGEAPGNDAE